MLCQYWNEPLQQLSFDIVSGYCLCVVYQHTKTRLKIPQNCASEFYVYVCVYAHEACFQHDIY